MRYTTRLAATLSTALALGWTAFGARADNAAMLIDVRAGSVQSAGKRLALLAGLDAGARLDLDAAASATIAHYGAGRQFDLEGPGSFTVSATGIDAAGGGRVIARAAVAAAFRDVRLRPSRSAQASMSMRGQETQTLDTLSPVGVWVLERQPVLRWTAVAGAEGYRVRLTDEAGKLLHEARAGETRAMLPPALVLEAGPVYVWQVEAMLPGGRRLESWAEFAIADLRRRELFEAARPAAGASFGERLLFAVLQDEAGMPDAARTTWDQLARERPGDPRLEGLRRRY